MNPSLTFNRLVDRMQLRSLEKRSVSHPQDWEGYFQALKAFKPKTLPYQIYLNQIWAEWKRLMEYLANESAPKRILEVGTGRGGSTYFLTKLGGEDSLVVTVDAEPKAKDSVDLYKRHRGQQVYSVTGNSHDPRTVEQVAEILGGQPVDLLYIDGDHTYEGVRKDFELYERFCGEKTVVCFHDIIPDHGTTKGIKTDAWTGEVYKFWAELKAGHETFEIVEEPDQNGFGIGVIPRLS